jgi:hypothetical protein
VDVGTAVAFTATLTGNGVAPTGALTLHDGSATVATQNVTNTGTFTFSIPTLAIGAHTLTTAYAGDANNSPATSNAITITVQPAATATSLTTSANPSVVGQPLTLTALYSGDINHTASTSPAVGEQIVQSASVALTSSLNPSISGTNVVFTATATGVGSLIPTGSITFSDGVNPLATVPLNAAGSASFQTAALAVGSHTIAASYTGDRNYNAATSSLIQTVQSANTQVALTAGANPAIYGTPLALTSTVASNGGVATGTVTFTDGGATVGTAVLNSAGVATLTTSSLAPGTHSIVAAYAGDGSASASISTPLTLNVRQLTSVALASSANPASTLSPVVLTATLINNGVTLITGAVTFTDGATLLGTAAVDTGGHATLNVPSLASGNHSIVAAYSGDNNDFAGVSPALAQSVQLRATTTALAASETDPNNPQQVTLIGVVQGSGPIPATGTITFTNGSIVIGSSPINSSGAATINITVDTSSTDTIVATYDGDASYASSASLATSVTGGPATQFTLSLTPPDATIQSKQHIVIDITASSINGFADKLQFGCLGLPFAATCTFSSVQANLAANGVSTVQLTIDTGDPLGAGAVASNERPQNSNVLLSFLPGGILAGLALFFRRRISMQGLLLLLFALALILPITGCAGLQTNGTPAGSYSFKVTASGQGTGATESQVMDLTVTQ